MALLNTLFDLSKFEKRKPADQKQFETANKALLIAFRTFVNLSFKNLHKKVLSAIDPLDQNKNLAAVVMNGYLVGHLKRSYPQYCGKATKLRFRLFINGESIYIKKLDEKSKLPSNIPTDQSLLIYNQLTDSTSDKGPIIFLGYTVNDAWSMITGIYAVCIQADNVIWMSDINDLGEMDQSPVVPLGPKPMAPRVKPGVNTKKRKAE